VRANRAVRIVTTATIVVLWTLVSGGQGGNTCTVSTTAVDFGAYDPYSTAPLLGQGSIQYRCFGSVRAIRVSISQGTAGSFNRYLSGSGTRLYYNLYLDAAQQTIWGDGSGGSQPLTQTGIASNVAYVATIYARIPPLQNVGLGVYSDGLVTTVDW
jgi:spore coat protein U-like protein